MKLLYKPYRLLLAVGLLLLIVSFFSIQQTFDIHLYDTYFVISTRDFLWGVALTAGLLTLLYELTARVLFSKLLTWIHISLTCLACIVLALPSFWGQPFPGDYSDWKAFDDFQKYNSFVATILMLAIFAQALFILNIMLGVIYKLRTGKQH